MLRNKRPIYHFHPSLVVIFINSIILSLCMIDKLVRQLLVYTLATIELITPQDIGNYVSEKMIDVLDGTRTSATASDSLDYFDTEHLQKGDIIMHTSTSSQSKWIKMLTSSPYTHTGIVNVENGSYSVIEASTQVKEIELATWIEKGVNRRFAVFRVDTAEGEDIIEEALRHLGKRYDSQFEPSDDKLYCSEFIYKVFEMAAHETLGVWEPIDRILQPIKSPELQDIVGQRFGDETPTHLVITPKSIADADATKLVFSNY